MPTDNIVIFMTLALISLMFSGCATVCHDRDIYKPSLINKGDTSVSVGQTNINIDIGSYANMDVFECGWAYRNYNLDPVALCFSIRVEDNHTFQFLEPKLKIFGKDGKEYLIKIDSIKYQINGDIKQDGKIDANSSLEPPTTSPIKKKESFKRNRYHATIEFDVASEFKGSWSTSSSSLALLVNSKLRKREYYTKATLPKSLRKGFYLEFSDVLVDKKKYLMPKIEFNYSNESTCRLAV